MAWPPPDPKDHKRLWVRVDHFGTLTWVRTSRGMTMLTTGWREILP